MKKIVHICDKFGVKGSSVHGVSRLFSWWMPLFDKSYFDVKLIGLRAPEKAFENLQKQGISVSSLNRGKFDFRTINDIVSFVKKHKTNILHLHGYGASNFGRIAGKLTRTKTIVHEHFVDPGMPKYQIPFDLWLSRHTDYGIAVSESVKKFMVEDRFLLPQKVQVVYNGAPIEQFSPVDTFSAARERQRWGIPDDYKIIATIGRLDKQKGNTFFIQAASILLKKYKKLKFLIVGDGPLEGALKDECKSSGIKNNVIFTGYCSNIPLMQTIIDIQVFPSLWEGTPLTLFEAMAMKKAIVSTNADGLGEILENGRNALVVPARNAELIASSIESLILDSTMKERLSEKAKKDSFKYDIQYTVNKMQTIYRKLLSNDTD